MSSRFEKQIIRTTTPSGIWNIALALKFYRCFSASINHRLGAPISRSAMIMIEQLIFGASLSVSLCPLSSVFCLLFFAKVETRNGKVTASAENRERGLWE
jgi:hypothetical protein